MAKLKFNGLLFSLIFFAAGMQQSCSKNQKTPTYIESYRKPGIPDEKVIQAAIDAAGEGGNIQFEPGRVYTIGNVILVKKFQTLVGNNASLLRANQSFSILATAASADERNLHLSSIPQDWSTGDQVQLFTDSTAAHSNSFADSPELPNIITKIAGNTIVLSSQIGRSVDGTITQWPAGTKVRKVFSLLRGDSINLVSAPFRVENLNFNGNRQNNNLNYYWNVNSTIFIRGLGSKIEDCRFFDIPNENIVGQGIYVTNCQAYNLNGSFVHLSGIDTIKIWPQKHSFISGNYINAVCLMPTAITRHSEAVFTTSFNGGFASIIGNRVYNCGEAAIGLIEYHIDTADGGKSDFIIADNLFKNCRRIVYDIRPVPENAYASTNIFISNNIFSNCGINDWSNYSFIGKYSGFKIGDNNLTDGTTWLLPSNLPGTAKLKIKKTGPKVR